MSGHSKQQIIEKIETATNNMQLFYQQAFINYRGCTIDTKELYTEIIAEYLLNNLEVLSNIVTISRESSYKTISHNGATALESSNREEERIALSMYEKEYDYIGKIIDYQIPLKNVLHDSGIGKIDLLSYDGEMAYILELKKPKSKETLLRCVLEGFTYLNTVDTCKLLCDYKLPPKTKVKAAPLVFYGEYQYKEYMSRPEYLMKLIHALDCTPIFLDGDLGSYEVKNA